MMRGLLVAGSLALVLLTAPPPQQARRDQPAAPDAPAARWLLGAFRPLFVQGLWWQLDAASREGRIASVLKLLQDLERAEPDSTRATLYRVRFLAYDLAPRAATTGEALALVGEALAVLDAARARRGPRPELALGEAMLLTSGEVLGTYPLQRAFRNRYRESPAERAVARLSEARAEAPQHRGLARVFGRAVRERAVELWLGDPKPDPAKAAQLLTAALAAAAEAGISDESALTKAYHAFAVARLDEDPTALARALDGLVVAVARIPDGPHSRRPAEALALELIAVSLLDFGAQSAAIAEPSVALSLLVALHSMRARALGWRESPAPTSPGEGRWATRFGTALSTLLSRAPHLRAAVPPALR